MLLGYNTNGLAHHEPIDALELLAELGYESVAITIDHHCLSPFAEDLPRQLARTRDALQRLKLRSVIETGGRFLLNRRVKHEPTLMTADASQRQRRIDFYRHAIDVAAELKSDCVSLWSGILRDDVSEAQAMDRLVAGLRPVLDYAQQRNVAVGFEPEPGMFVDTMARFDELLARLEHPALRLTLDIGHLHCQGETPIADYIRRYAPLLVNVHLEDMRRGVHEHLPFGEGEIDFPPVLQALADCGFLHGVHVELSRHSPEGPAQAEASYRYLRRIWP